MADHSTPARWDPAPAEIFALGPVIPVLVVRQVKHALAMAEALLEGGIRTLEVTLRTPEALAVIETIAARMPEAVVGAGTVTTPDQLTRAIGAGARFAISPGLTTRLLEAAGRGPVPLIPGIATISELMTGLDAGCTRFKFFPAEASGGPRALKAIAGPFPDVRFCPTGGITPENMGGYLALGNVECVGGSWLVSDEILEGGDWGEITRRARAALAGAC